MFLNRIAIVFFILLPIPVKSQDFKVKKDSIHSNELEEVVITATRTKKQLAALPMPITVISKKQIAQTGATRLKDIIEEQTGIIMVPDFGTSEGVQLQGMDAAYTLILIDGLPLIGRTSGNLDLNRVSVGDIKQIEIVKGPSSSLYGSEALGGVINIITENPTSNITKGNVSSMALFGAKNELDITAGFVHKKDELSVVGNVNLNSSGGFDLSPKEETKTAYPHQIKTGNLRFSYNFNSKWSITTSGRYFQELIKNDTGDAFRNDFSVTTKLEHKITPKTTVDYLLYGTGFYTESLFNTEVSEYNQTLFRPEVKIHRKIGNDDLIGGFGGNFDALKRTFFDGKESYNSQYAFAQYDTELKEGLDLILGARFDRFNRFKSAFSPKLSANYAVNKRFTVKASVGFGYKVPDFRQLFFNFRNTSAGYVVFGTEVLQELYGNEPRVQALDAELTPESSIGYNVGFQLKPLQNLTLNINLFRNDIKNLINTFVVATDFSDLPNTSVFSYENRNEVYTQGVELDIMYKLNNNIKFFVGYQFLDTADKEEVAMIKADQVFFRRNESAPSEVLTISNYYGLANRSRHTANAKLFYTSYQHDFSANIRALYRSKYALFDTNDSQAIIDVFDDFVASNLVVNVAINKTFFNLMNVQFGIDNLFNEKGEKNIETFENNDSVLQLGNTFYGRIQFKF